MTDKLTVKDQIFLSVLNGLLSNPHAVIDRSDGEIIRRAMSIALEADKVRLSPISSTEGF